MCGVSTVHQNNRMKKKKNTSLNDFKQFQSVRETSLPLLHHLDLSSTINEEKKQTQVMEKNLCKKHFKIL